MTLKQCQEDVDKFMSQYRDGYWDPAVQITCLTEEVGELAREVNHHFGPKKKKQHEPETSLGKEMADIIFILCCLANSQKIDLQQSWEETIEKFNTRDKHRFLRK